MIYPEYAQRWFWLNWKCKNCGVNFRSTNRPHYGWIRLRGDLHFTAVLYKRMHIIE